MGRVPCVRYPSHEFAALEVYANFMCEDSPNTYWFTNCDSWETIEQKTLKITSGQTAFLQKTKFFTSTTQTTTHSALIPVGNSVWMIDAKVNNARESSIIRQIIPSLSFTPSVERVPPGVLTEVYDTQPWHTKFERDTNMSVESVYEDWGFPQKNYAFMGTDIGVDAKIISGSGQDLLVYNDFIDNTEGTTVIAVEPSKFSMYDGKDRKFSNISYSTITQFEGEVKNPNFSWDEDCIGHSLDVQPGLTGKLKICFEIPKNSDHFKITYTKKWLTSDKYDIFLLAIFDRLALDNSSTTTKIPQQQTQQSKGGGCLIATATYGSEMAPQVQFLRELRDNTVLQTESGTSFMTGFNQFYYSFSPAVADYERENPAFKEAVKITLTPLLTSLTLLQYADIDSESEMLGYGIGIILLNIGMYFVAPAVLIMKVRKRI